MNSSELPTEVKIQMHSEQEIKDMHDFYIVTGTASGANIKFDKLLLTERLRKLGFIRYDQPGGKQFEYVRLQDGKIRIVSVTQIKDTFEDYLINLPDYDYPYTYKDSDNNQIRSTTKVTGYKLQRIMYNSIDTYFGSTMDRLRPYKPIEFMRDQSGIKYLYFRNCVLKITRSGIEKLPYDQADGYIWEANIIDRDFNEDYTVGDFEQFIANICNKNRDRKEALMSMIGYLMHDFYDCNLRAVLLTDVNDGENQTAAAGGTGKGLIGKALGQMLNRTRDDVRYCAVPGKGFDAKDDKRYQLADISTQLIHIEDLDKNFSLSSLYNDITDGATFRKMYGSTSIHFVKFLLSVNHTIRLDAASDKRRVYVFELFNYYNEKHTPIDDFGRMFFGGEWEEKDWNQFYTFMIRCCIRYLYYGVEQVEQVNYKKRRLLEVFEKQKDLLYYFNQVEKDALAKDKRVYKKECFETFDHRYPRYVDSQRTFTEKFRTYMQLREIDYREVRGNAGSDYFVLNPIDGTEQTTIDFQANE